MIILQYLSIIILVSIGNNKVCSFGGTYSNKLLRLTMNPIKYDEKTED